MPYKNPKDRPKQKNKPVGSKEFKARMERQRARRKMDSAGKDANKNGKADKREGKDVAHKKPLSRGGSNKDGVTVQSRRRNRCHGGFLEGTTVLRCVNARDVVRLNRSRMQVLQMVIITRPVGAV